MKPFPVTDHLVSKKTFVLDFDRNLNAWKTTPQLNEEALKAYYPKDDYASHLNQAKDLKSKVYLWIKSFNIRTKLRWINRCGAKGKLLDYGAGNGAFAQAAAEDGWDVFAYDPAFERITQSNNEAFTRLDNTFEINEYNIITLWHVFEHLSNPVEKLNQLYNSLVPGGVLVLALPNNDAWDAQHYKANWAAYDVPRHAWHYNKASITQLAKHAGFTAVSVRNMFWDAFYISLLSEQYRNSKLPWILAVFKGIYSNFVGWRKKNTSSLTFILQKPK